MSSCEGCNANGQCSDQKKESCQVQAQPLGKIGAVIGIMSGKGGVGKSTVSALLATALVREGFRVGILDADITGPSIPRLMGVANERMGSDGVSMLPVLSADGIKIASLNLILEEEDRPVVWRGPLITATVMQFWKEVNWGEIDCLLVDMPPGTGDVALTVMQSIPLNGLLMVTLPQELVSMIVGKAVKMAALMEIPVLGVIENMSYTVCPKCGEKVPLFASEDSHAYLESLRVERLAQLPMSPRLLTFGKAGIGESDGEINAVFTGVAKRLLEKLSLAGKA